MQPGWCQPIRQEFMENECEALPGVAYPGVRDNRSTINTKTGYDDDDDDTGVRCNLKRCRYSWIVLAIMARHLVVIVIIVVYIITSIITCSRLLPMDN